ncbi:hypothetical protein EPHNCH_0884 [Anaplasma phagocytophilum str. NCH-1]|uniref:Uncharacterized protein n=1 Tax=Anaplasma phagocytophilum str. NCH-1 TaxID=1359161 RepID=A0A0F3NAW1_ANAPH|nr:hypothetical protein EPHNCH_0884 [Anaplasma phagocytophilum str. NCH-1]
MFYIFHEITARKPQIVFLFQIRAPTKFFRFQRNVATLKSTSIAVFFL